MRDFKDSFRLDKMRSGNAAFYLLKEEFENFLSSPYRVDVCDGIAKYFYQLDQFGDAGNWYETAGKLILAEPSTPAALKSLSALVEFEKALDSHQRNGDDDAVDRCSALVRELQTACAPA